jgi:magnesium-protoporphyrin O-methyltransferase
MASCCNARGCDGFFTARLARRAAKRYRKRGLDKTAKRIVETLEARGVHGATILEIGGGLGEIDIELLKRGAARAVNLELSPGYAEEAARLQADAGLQDRLEHRLHDIAADPTSTGPADIVVMHRVVCCYPDYARLLEAAATHARSHIIFSHPPRTPGTRLIIAAQNLAFRLLRREFRTFVHPPAAMLAVVQNQGFRHTYTHRSLTWQIAGLDL